MQEPEMELVPENKPVSQELQDTITEPFQRPTTEGRHGNSSDKRVSEAFAVMQHIRKKNRRKKR